MWFQQTDDVVVCFYIFHSRIPIENYLKVVIVVVSLHIGRLRNAIETGLSALGLRLCACSPVCFCLLGPPGD